MIRIAEIAERCEKRLEPPLDRMRAVNVGIIEAALREAMQGYEAEADRLTCERLDALALYRDSQKWSRRWKKLAQWRGWPASKHERTRRKLQRTEANYREAVEALEELQATSRQMYAVAKACAMGVRSKRHVCNALCRDALAKARAALDEKNPVLGRGERILQPFAPPDPTPDVSGPKPSTSPDALDREKELDELLNAPDDREVEVLPDGSVREKEQPKPALPLGHVFEPLRAGDKLCWHARSIWGRCGQPESAHRDAREGEK